MKLLKEYLPLEAKGLLVLLLFFLLSPMHAFSNSASLLVSPTVTEIKAKSPSEIKTSIIIKNNTESEQDLKIKLIPFKQAETLDGQIVLLAQKNSSLESILSQILILENGEKIDEIHLNSFEERKLSLGLRITKDETPGDYYFSVVFLTIPQEEKTVGTSSLQSLGIATNVLLSIGDEPARGKIKQFSTPMFLVKGGVPITLLFENQSKHFVKPQGSIIIKNISGRTIEKIDILPQRILAKSSRFLTHTSLSARTNQPILLWEKEFLFGLYTANATISVSDNGPILTSTTRFLYLPIQILVPVILFFIVVIGVLFRLKKINEIL